MIIIYYQYKVNGIKSYVRYLKSKIITTEILNGIIS